MVRRLLMLIALLAGCTFSVPRDLSTDAATPVASPTSTEPATLVSAGASASPGPSASAGLASAAPSTQASSDPFALSLDTTSCEGGVVLDWSASASPEFHHYSALRSPVRTIETAWPPIAPAVDWGDTYTTDPFVTSGADASLIPTDRIWFYRVVAYDAGNRVLGASPVVSGRMSPVADLGVTRASAADAGVRIDWEPYGGFSHCFSSYRVLYGTGVANTVLAVVSAQTTDSLVTRNLHAGTTYAIRVEAIRTTTLASFVVGSSQTVIYTVP
jgi:hypothetical protein